MRTLRVVILSAAVILVLVQNSVAKNGNVGIYGIVDKVVFEPDGSTPERIQIWGLIVVLVPIASGCLRLLNGGFSISASLLTERKPQERSGSN